MTAKKTAIAKITPPAADRVFPRERLFRRIDALGQKPIVWIAAPPGSGKTMLVASYIEARKLPCIWYQIDEGDSDIATFFYYMGLAAKKAAPRIKPLPLLTQEYLRGIPTFTKRYFEALFNRLKGPFWVVFDNYQEVTESSIFHEVMRNGLSEIPEGIHVILISRSHPPPCMARLFANDRVELIGWDELCLTADETAQIAQLHGKRSLSNETVSRLHRHAQGWAAGLVLMVKKAETGDINLEHSDGAILEKVFDYFAGEVFDRMDATVRSFLLKTAFFPKMTPSMAERLTGVGHADRILSELNRENYFTEKRYDSGTAYQYHALFREFLLARARMTLAPEEADGIRIQAAKLLEESGQIEEAMDLHMESCQWEALVRLIIEHAPGLIAGGRNRTLESRIRSVPPQARKENPWLHFWMGVCLLPDDPPEARGYFEKAFEAFKPMGDLFGTFESWCGIVDTFVFEWGNFGPLDRWIMEGEKILESHPDFPSRQTEIRVVACMINALVHRQPDKRKIPRWEKRAKDLLSGRDDFNLQMTLINPLFLYYLWMGEYGEIALLLGKFSDKAVASSNPFPAIVWKAYEAFYGWIMGRPEEGLEAVSQGLKIAEKTGALYWNSFLYTHGAHCGLTWGDGKTVAYYLGKLAAELGTSRRLDVCHYHLIASMEALSRCDISNALHHADLTTRLSIECGAPWPIAANRITLAETLFESGQRKEALIHLSKALKMCRMMGSHALAYKCLVAKSYFAFRDGKEADGLKYLRAVMKLGREKKYVNAGGWRSDVMSLLSMKALEAGIEVEYVQDLVKRRGLSPDPDRACIESWPYPLMIYTLGRFEVVKDGKPLSFSGKVQQKPLFMLKALIALGGRGVSAEKLIDVLWPETDGDLAHASFDTTLHRLRRLVGDQALQLADGLLSLDPRLCWVDVWVFERILEKTEASVGEKRDEVTEDESLRWAGNAMDLYKGHFLSAETSQWWTISIRERLRSKFVRFVIKLGSYHEQTGHWERALEYFQKGLDLDDLAEEFYQHQMICYLRLGQEKEATAVYRRCRSVLSAALGINPSSKTEEIYRSIRRNLPPGKA